MTDTRAQLEGLNNLLTEYYSGPSPVRLQEIEQILVNFRRQPDSWKQCRVFLSLSDSDYVVWFCLTVFEELVTRLWGTVETSAKIEIRLFFFQFLQSYDKRKKFVQSKILEIIVDVGKVDWPHDYPNFFPSVIEQITTRGCEIRGLNLLKTLVEEIMEPRRDIVDSTRLTYLRNLLYNQYVNCIKLVTDKFSQGAQEDLATILYKRLSAGGLSTSLRVPGLGGIGQELSHQNHNFSSAPNSPIMHRQRVVSHSTPSSPLAVRSNDAFQFPSVGSNNMINEDTKNEKMILECLNCLISMVSHAKSEHLQQVDLISKLFEAISSVDISEAVKDKCFECLIEVIGSFAAIGAANSSVLVQQMVQFLRNLANGTIKLDDDAEGASGKFIEVVRLFVGKNFKSIEQQGLSAEFLNILLEWTTSQKNLVCFQRTLEIWTDIMEEHFNDSMVDSCGPVLVKVCAAIIQRGQFGTNQQELINEVEGEDVFDEECEIAIFIRDCSNLVTVVNRGFSQKPDLFMDLLIDLNSIFQGHCETYSKYQQNLNTGNTENSMLYFGCRDLYTSLSILDQMISSCPLPEEILFVFIDVLTKLLKDGVQSQMFVRDLACSHIHAQIVSTMSSCWYQLSTRQVSVNTMEILLPVLNSIYPLFSLNSPKEVLVKAAKLIHTVATNNRPPALLSDGSTLQFLQNMSGASGGGLPVEVQELIFQGMSNMMVLPWKNVVQNEQKFQERSTLFTQFIQHTLLQYQALLNASSPEDVKKIKAVSKVIKGIISGVKEANRNSKMIIFENVKGILPLLANYLNRIDVLEPSLEVLLATIESLKVLFDENSLKQILLQVFELAKRNDVAEKGPAVIEKLLLIFEEISKDGSKRYKSFVPEILGSCLNTLLPYLQGKPDCIDKLELLFKVVLETVLTHWNIFYATPTSPLQEHYMFNKVFEILYSVLCGKEINLFKQTLEQLNDLNSKRGLFKKDEFKTMTCFFIQQLILVLLQKSHDLLIDKILETLFEFACADWDFFLQQAFPQSLSSLCTPEQAHVLYTRMQTGTDFPTFKRNLKLIVHDIRYFRFMS